MAYFDFLGLGVASLISLLLMSPSHINIIDSQITHQLVVHYSQEPVLNVLKQKRGGERDRKRGGELA